MKFITFIFVLLSFTLSGQVLTMKDIRVNDNQNTSRQYIGVALGGKQLLSNERLPNSPYDSKSRFSSVYLPDFITAIANYLNDNALIDAGITQADAELKFVNVANILDFGATEAQADNRDEIQAAADYAVANGIPMYVPAGEWEISTLNGSNRGLELSDNMQIIGEGDASIIRDLNTLNSHVFILVDGDNVQIQNIRIEGNNTAGTSAININVDADFATVDNVTFSDGFGWNVFSKGNEGTNVRNCRMEHIGSANCIEYNECIRGSIINNIIYGNTTNGGPIVSTSQSIEIYNLAATVVKGYHIISGNKIRNVRRGIAMVADDNSIIVDNNFDVVGEMAIHTSYDDVTTTVPSKNIIISNNRINDVGFQGSYPGIQALGDNIKIIGNIITESNVSGITNRSPGGLVSNNHVYNSGGLCIFNGATGINTTIVGNVAINGTRGIVNEADFVTITGNIAGEDDASATMDLAIFNDASANDVVMSGNTSIGGYAILSNGTTNVSIYGNNARIGGKLNINAADNINTVEIATSTNDDGIRLKGSGVGGPTFRLDATNATPANRYSSFVNVWNGTDTWGMGFRGDQNFILRNYITASNALAIDVTNNRLTIVTPTFADDAAAGAGGVTAGQVYKTAAGDLKVKL
jgi:hypothetical protein